MSDLPEKTDWLSGSEQLAWFNKFKSYGDRVTGIPLSKFKNFIDITVNSYCQNLIKQDDITCSNQYKGGLCFSDLEKSQLFALFDLNDDGYIDINGFKNLSENWLHKFYNRKRAFIIVDVQNDFIDGSLALINGPAEQDGVEVVDVINRLLDLWTFDAIVYTQDWHPRDHIGFYDNLHLRRYRLKDEKNHSNNNNNLVNDGIDKIDSFSVDEDKEPQFKFGKLIHDAKLFDVVLFDDGKLEQKLWPIHCVQNSWGAELHPKLKVVPDAIRIFKGTLSHIDAYSAFWDNMHLNETGLRQQLVMRDIDDVFVCGLALDYCVASSALDSERAGFKTYVIEDACRGINHQDMACKRDEMKNRRIILINSQSIGPKTMRAMQALEWTRDFINKRLTQ